MLLALRSQVDVKFFVQRGGLDARGSPLLVFRSVHSGQEQPARACHDPRSRVHLRSLGRMGKASSTRGVHPDSSGSPIISCEIFIPRSAKAFKKS